MKAPHLMELLREDVVAAAPALLGATLVRGVMSARIVETEAYRGDDDPACHAFGKTKMKNMAIFGEPGRAYIYLNYGMHWMLNVVAHAPGSGCAVLIRAAVPLSGIEEMRQNRPVPKDRELLSGPGKLAKAFGISSVENGTDLFSPVSQGDLHIVPSQEPPVQVVTGPRIGITEGNWHEVPWRFLDVSALEWVSRPLPPKPHSG